MGMMQDLNSVLSTKGLHVPIPDVKEPVKIEQISEEIEKPVEQKPKQAVDLTEDLMKCIGGTIDETVEVVEEDVRKTIIEHVDFGLLKDLFKR